MDFDELERMSNNPSRVIATVFNGIEKAVANGGGVINSTGHPFAYAVDLIVGTNYGFISRLGDSTAESHLVHARNIADLSKKMSDEDWYGIFAEPSSTAVRFIISEESLDRFSIRYDDVSGSLKNTYRKLVLPPDTVFNVAGIPFLLENPVEIRVMDHGGYQVVYDSSRQSKLNPLTTNSPDLDTPDIDGRRYLAIHLPVRQLKITEYPNRGIHYSTGFSETIQIDQDQSLYAIRAFITPIGGNVRNEMAVVFNNDIFDPAMPTLTVDMLTEKSFNVAIPSVYLQNNTAIGTLTILVYTTQGAYYRDLKTLKTQDHTVAYYNYANDKGKLNMYEAPFKSINDVMMDSIEPIVGGRDATPFEELKNLMIYGHRRRLIPVSDTDLSQFMLRNGYSSVKSIDLVTSRLYRVTKDLPLQEDKLFQDDTVARFNSSIGTHVGSLLTSLEELVGSGNAIDNGRRVTVMDKTVFDITKQTPYMVSKQEVDRLMGLSNALKIDALQYKTMVFNPFIYVIDTTKDRASCRLYRVAKPMIEYQQFRYENTSFGVKVGVGAIQIKSDRNGYVIQIKTQSSDSYKQIADDQLNIQLAIEASDSKLPATMKATLLGKDADGERIFQFVLPSQYDIDDVDQLDLGGFNQFGNPQPEVRANLNVRANFIFTYTEEGQPLMSESDMKIDQNLFDEPTIAIIETEYSVEFGRALKSLYTRIRPMVGLAQYKKYEQDVPDVYEENEYLYKDGKLVIDPKTNLPIVVHKKGEVRKTPDGKVILKYQKGDTVFDDQGKPVPLEPRKMKYHWDFIGFDFNYLVSQDEYDTSYEQRVEDFFVDEVVGQLDGFNRITLDETVLVFKPRSTMGYVHVTVNEAVERVLKTDLSFRITYSLTKEGMRNLNLKSSLDTSTHRTINDILRQGTVSVSEIVSALRANGGDDVLDVKVIMLAGTDTVDIITNVDNTNGFSVRKVIDQTADRYLTIKEDMDVQFKRHYQEN